MSTRSFSRAKRFSTVDILFLLFCTVFALGNMPVEIKSKFSAEIFELKMSLRAGKFRLVENGLKRSQASDVQKIFLYYKQKQKIGVFTD